MKKENPAKMTIHVPEFDAFFDGDPLQFRIAITDHDPIIIETAVGFLASLNVWCPGSPISPSLNPTKTKGVLTLKSQSEQMKLMANTLFDLASKGVVGFMLQEVPAPNDSNFVELNAELKRLCSLHHANTTGANPIPLEFQHWLSTSETRSGTCSLVNTSRLEVKLKASAAIPLEMQGRFACYEIRDKNSPNIVFDLYNIHGHFKHQNSVADFILDCIKYRVMVCGDLNITEGSHAAKKLDAALPNSQHYLSTKGRIRTIDVFYDSYSPSLYQQNQQNQQVSQNVLGISMFNKIVKGNRGMIQLHFNTDSDAATFLTNARQFFNDDKTIVARKDSPRIIRLSQEQYAKLQNENEAILPKPDSLSHNKK